MVGGVLFEHGHRLVATFVGVLTVTLAVLLSQWEPRVWVRWLAWGALLAVVLQGLLGGITVLLRLPTAVSVTHACLAQTFFCLTVVLAVCTAPSWHAGAAPWVEHTQPSLRLLATMATGAVCLQLILGALMRHTGAGLAIPDFPLAFGRVWPPLESPAVLLHFLHRLGAAVVTLSVGWMVVCVVRRYSTQQQLLFPALLLAALLVTQLVLGAYTIWTQRAVWLITAHVGVGAAVLATSLVLTLRVYRCSFLPVTPTLALPRRGGGSTSQQVTA
jgi:cytochrome c oxidase assembly protein subunit 15